MRWETLFSPRRTGDAPDKVKNADTARHSYMRDYDRIIFSSAFRRLQNKTQVFPLPGPVFVHNRLTHSLEVASVGRSLGKIVGERIAESLVDANVECLDFYKNELPYVIASACLAHDIGNPPFGHSGEDAIRAYFSQLSTDMKSHLEQKLSADQLLDFQYFEGNSNAIRTLVNTFGEPRPGGYRLTFTTLASIVKYPCSSSKGFKKGAGIHLKKSGFFESEKEQFAIIADTLGIPKLGEDTYARHPFVYLVEAADDICYRVIDLEDAHRLGIVSLDTFKSLLLPFFENNEYYLTRATIENVLSQIVDPNQQAQYIRANWIGLMTTRLAAIFIENQQAILEGTYSKDLLSSLSPEELVLVEKINHFSYKYIYNHKAVVEIEISGFEIMGCLLQHFVEAVVYPHKIQSEKLLQLIPKQFPINVKDDNMYANLQSVVDYISGMTDLFAIDLFRKIKGIEIARFG